MWEHRMGKELELNNSGVFQSDDDGGRGEEEGWYMQGSDYNNSSQNVTWEEKDDDMREKVVKSVDYSIKDFNFDLEHG